MRIASATTFTVLTLAAAAPAHAQLRPLVEPPASAEAAAQGVEVFMINDSTVAQAAAGPSRIETIARDGTRIVLAIDSPTPGDVPPGGFVKIRYRPVLVATAAAPIPAAPKAPAATVVAAATGGETVVATGIGSSSGFFDRFKPHEPVYGVFGLKDSGAKLQASFAVAPFGPGSILKDLNVAYTQTLFWELATDSGPIRPITYSPEVYYDVPLSATARLSIGYRHDSNGEGAATSIDVNRGYIRAVKTFDLGDGWSAEIAPQAWFYFGKQGVAPDIERYWGYTALQASIARVDGVKLSGWVRGNPDSGFASGEVLLSYPIASLGLGDVGIYLFGQGFTGFGESLTGYNRRDTHARLGIAFVR